ncbi:MAG: polymer-forming cytoskeletal protein [Peptostreptococcaceae bacterium]|nr:polymer-forming cytoskeletal protein [Peptostreptococcaceae bacterium]
MSARTNFSQAVHELMGRATAETEDDEVLSDDLMKTEELNANEKRGSLFNASPKASIITKIGETTTIAKGTIMIGEIRSEGNVNMNGDIKGTITSTGDITVSGKVLGSIDGKDIELKGAAVQGIITATGNVSIDESSVLVGDINASSLNLTGRVKGNIVVKNEATLNENSILIGDVTAKRVSMHQAKVQGRIDVSPEDANIEIDLKKEMSF